ncbi:hypothetical protein J6590_070049 [Homalodisca vitripennis]|nr:hypothetical protein J6590_070049 [Homalodisca vitripennis]
MLIRGQNLRKAPAQDTVLLLTPSYNEPGFTLSLTNFYEINLSACHRKLDCLQWHNIGGEFHSHAIPIRVFFASTT